MSTNSLRESKVQCGSFDVILNNVGQPTEVRPINMPIGGVAVKKVIDFRNDNFRNVTVRVELENGQFFYGNYHLHPCGSRASVPIGRMANTVEEIVPVNLREHLLAA